MPDVTPNPDPAAEPKTVRLRARSYDPDSMIEVTLRPRVDRGLGRQAFDVYGPHPSEILTLTWVGVVESYEGSLDRKIPIGGRFLNQPGKRRTLWSAHIPGERLPWNSHVSRAEAIRRLLDTASRRG